jgi:hypothetical protein
VDEDTHLKTHRQTTSNYSVANTLLPRAGELPTPSVDQNSGAEFPGPGVPRVIHHMNLGKDDLPVDRQWSGTPFPGSILCWGG